MMTGIYDMICKMSLLCRTLLRTERSLLSRSISSSNRSLLDISNLNDLKVLEDVHVEADVISNFEHDQIVIDVERSLRRRRYEQGHWDGVIESFREITKRDWTDTSRKVFKRLIESPAVSRLNLNSEFLPPHVLDLSKEGFIKPHIDSIIASGEMVAGLSLLSSAVMVLTRESESIRILLPPRSFYVLSGRARFEFKHEILPGITTWNHDNSTDVIRDRRISVILRDDISPSPNN